MQDWAQILITAVGVLGSASIWRYFELRLKVKSEIQQTELLNNDGVQYRDDLKERVKNLEILLQKSAEEKDQLRDQVLDLTAEVHALRTKVEYLAKENEILKASR